MATNLQSLSHRATLRSRGITCEVSGPASKADTGQLDKTVMRYCPHVNAVPPWMQVKRRWRYTLHATPGQPFSLDRHRVRVNRSEAFDHWTFCAHRAIMNRRNHSCSAAKARPTYSVNMAHCIASGLPSPTSTTAARATASSTKADTTTKASQRMSLAWGY